MLCPSTPPPLPVKMSEHSLQANDPRNGTTLQTFCVNRDIIPPFSPSQLTYPPLTQTIEPFYTLPQAKTKTIIIGSSWHHFSHSASYAMWLNISHYHLIFATSQNFTVDHCYNRQRNRYFQRGNKGNPSHAGKSIIPNTGLRFFIIPWSISLLPWEKRVRPSFQMKHIQIILYGELTKIRRWRKARHCTLTGAKILPLRAVGPQQIRDKSQPQRRECSKNPGGEEKKIYQFKSFTPSFDRPVSSHRRNADHFKYHRRKLVTIPFISINTAEPPQIYGLKKSESFLNYITVFYSYHLTSTSSQNSEFHQKNK